MNEGVGGHLLVEDSVHDFAAVAEPAQKIVATTGITAHSNAIPQHHIL